MDGDLDSDTVPASRGQGVSDSRGAVPAPRTSGGAAALAAMLADPGALLVATDFDGVLSPIVADPDRAFADEGAMAALARLGRSVRQVAVITGRPARGAVRLGGLAGRAGLERLVVLGQYGVERWDAATDRYVEPEPPAGIAAVRAVLPELLADPALAGVWVEDKGRALGLHTRRTSDPAAVFERLRETATRLAVEHELQLEPGKNVWELRARGVDKGHALRMIMAESAASSVIYLGDDLGDLPAFAALGDLRAAGTPTLGVCALSAEQDAVAAVADVVVDGVGGVAAWLAALADRISAE